MVFSYYHTLSAAQKGTYRKSDSIEAVPLPHGRELQPLIPKLASSLQAGDRPETEALCRAIAGGIARALEAPPLRVRVLSARPSESWGELHGLYEPAAGRASAIITVWMRTAKHRRVVAFKSFLRTLLHEVCHHLDYEYLKLGESFHTEGFYKRESSLFHQLVPPAAEEKSF